LHFEWFFGERLPSITPGPVCPSTAARPELSEELTFAYAACFQYFMSRHYKYLKTCPFTGKFIYNPYSSPRSYWWKSNFHAHSIAWRLTNGHQYPGQIISHFKKDMKYDIACISNYEKRTPYMPVNSPKYIQVYEHGYNIDKVHQLVFGKRKDD
jgi:hypothetical protein